MIELITSINDALNGFIWGVPAMVCIIGVGLYLAIRTNFVQLRKFGYSMKSTLGKIMNREKAQAGSITPFQAVCTALAATVGTGNIAGVAGAIAIGGPGAVFWMWISALLGMGTKFAEVTLAVHFRERNDKGDYVGGPMYYIKNGLGSKWMWLAYLYAFFGVCAVFGTGNAGNVAGTDGGCQCGADRLEGGNCALSGIAFFQNAADGVLHGIAELANLNEPGPQSQIKTYTDNADHGGYAPDEVVQGSIDVCNDFQHVVSP